MTEKVKLKNLCAVIGKDGKVEFGILNNDETRYKFLTSKEIYDVESRLETRIFEDLGYSYEINAYKIMSSTGKTTVACPLIYSRRATDLTGQDVFIECDQIGDVFDHFIRRCGGDKSGRVKKIEKILYNALGIDEKEDEFCNDNRNEIVDVKCVTKLERAIANTVPKAKKEVQDTVSKTKKEVRDQEAYDRTRDF